MEHGYLVCHMICMSQVLQREPTRAECERAHLLRGGQTAAGDHAPSASRMQGGAVSPTHAVPMPLSRSAAVPSKMTRATQSRCSLRRAHSRLYTGPLLLPVGENQRERETPFKGKARAPD